MNEPQRPPREEANRITRLTLSQTLELILTPMRPRSHGRHGDQLATTLAKHFQVSTEAARLLISDAAQSRPDEDQRRLRPIRITRLHPGTTTGAQYPEGFFHYGELYKFDPNFLTPTWLTDPHNVNTQEILGFLRYRLKDPNSAIPRDELLRDLKRHFGIGTDGDHHAAEPLFQAALDRSWIDMRPDGSCILTEKALQNRLCRQRP